MMTHPWSEDVSYNLDIVKKLISEHTNFVINSLVLLGSGWDNVVYLINNKFVIRLVKKEAGIEGSLAENSVLKMIPKMPIKTPNIINQGFYEEKWPWIIYPVIEGSPLYETNYCEQVLRSSSETLAQFLKILHAQNIQNYKGLRGDFNNHMNVTKRIVFAEKKIQELSSLNIIQPKGIYYNLLDEVRALSEYPYNPTICHGDFKSAHILFYKQKLSGVIDWGDTHVGHPSTDLAVAYSFVHPSERERFKEIYGGTDEVIWKLTQFRAFWHSLAILEYTFLNKIKNRFENTMKSLENIFL